MAKPIIFPTLRRDHEPTRAQIEAGNYRKPRIKVAGMEIAVENPAGSVRSGVDRGGRPWQTRMLYDYGYIVGSRGVDGDEVDCYVGPDPAAPMVYVIHQRKAGDWDRYDEDKCMIGFASEAEARAVFLQHYNDPRFLGDVTAMPIEEFRAKVRATRDGPAMIKSQGPVILLIKSLVHGHVRHMASGKVVSVSGYNTGHSSAKVADPRQLLLFGSSEDAATQRGFEAAYRQSFPGLQKPSGSWIKQTLYDHSSKLRALAAETASARKAALSAQLAPGDERKPHVLALIDKADRAEAAETALLKKLRDQAVKWLPNI